MTLIDEEEGDWTIHDEDGAWEPWWMGERLMFGVIGVCIVALAVMAFKAAW